MVVVVVNIRVSLAGLFSSVQYVAGLEMASAASCLMAGRTAMPNSKPANFSLDAARFPDKVDILTSTLALRGLFRG